jgi:histone deacetylase complex regulatory component SIN3
MVVSTRSQARAATMSAGFFVAGDLCLDTNDAASALTYLRVLSDISESPDYAEAMKYLRRVQAHASAKQYVSFVGVLKEFHEDVVREINEKKDYVIKYALTLFQDHADLILGLGDYIPELLDTLDPEPEPPHPSLLDAFMLKVQKRFLHSDHVTYMKITVTLHEFLVDMTMDTHTAKEEMSLLLQRHNDLWKEFESFLPPPLRAGPSSAPNP